QIGRRRRVFKVARIVFRRAVIIGERWRDGQQGDDGQSHNKRFHGRLFLVLNVRSHTLTQYTLWRCQAWIWLTTGPVFNGLGLPAASKACPRGWSASGSR